MLIDLVVLGLALGGLPWLLSALLLPRWLRRTRVRLPGSAHPVFDRVRVVVPARDEAATIGRAVQALRAVPGRVTVRIIDDHSTDGTNYLAFQAISDDPRFRVVPGRDLPPGWGGKAFACSQGVDGPAEWLLFVDADVIVDPRLPQTLQRIALDRGSDLISAFGTWELPSFGAQWLVPALGWIVRGAVDAGRVAAGRQAFANGQVILVRRSTYERIGGHGAVRGEVLDDVGLAAAVQRAGGRVDIVYCPEGFMVRAYESASDLMRGYRKNLHAGLGRRRWLGVLAAIGVLWAFVGPFVGLVLAVSGGSVLVGAPACLAGVALMLAVRVVLERIEGRSGVMAAFQPFAGLPIAWVFLTSALGRSASWKGREFIDGRVGDGAH